MRVNGHQVVFIVLNALHYLKEEVADCSMISSLENIIHKNLLKSINILHQELGKLNKKVEENEGIICGPLSKSTEKEHMEILELTFYLKKSIATSVKDPPTLELKHLPTHL